MSKFWPKVYPNLQWENGKNKPENQQIININLLY